VTAPAWLGFTLIFWNHAGLFQLQINMSWYSHNLRSYDNGYVCFDWFSAYTWIFIIW